MRFDVLTTVKMSLLTFWLVTPRGLLNRQIASGQGLPIWSERARECLHRTKAVEGSGGGKGEAACTVLYSCID
jgi:hypothetical protein